MAPSGLPSLRFGPFTVTSQVFHISPTRLSYALVNLKQLLPGHVLVCPVRVVPRLGQLDAHETTDLFATVQRVRRMLDRVYAPQAFNVAVQDGAAAGQSVPHVHVHVIPRKGGDMEARGGSDALYNEMDGVEGDLGAAFLELRRAREQGYHAKKEFTGGPDSDRKPRTEEEMSDEAEWFKREMATENPE